MNWILDNPFVLSVSFHDGRVVVNYPWDDSPCCIDGEKARDSGREEKRREREREKNDSEEI